MSADKEKQARTYSEMITDIKYMSTPRGYKNREVMFENYRVKGYIPISTTYDQFIQLYKFVQTRVINGKATTQRRYKIKQIGEVDSDTATHVTYFKTHFENLWDVSESKPEDFGQLAFAEEMIRIKQEMEEVRAKYDVVEKENLVKELNAVKITNDQLMQMIQKEETEHARERNELTEKISQLTGEIEYQNIEINKLKEENKKHADHIKILNHYLMKANSDKMNSESSVNDMTKQKGEEVMKLYDRITILEKEVIDLRKTLKSTDQQCPDSKKRKCDNEL